MFVIVWLRVEQGKDFCKAHKFSLLLGKTQSLQIGMKMGEKKDKNI